MSNERTQKKPMPPEVYVARHNGQTDLLVWEGVDPLLPRGERATRYVRADTVERVLRNVLALAMKRRLHGFKDGDADHLMRFCREAGIEPNPLRSPGPRPHDGGTG
jgi:hypothetical protein